MQDCRRLNQIELVEHRGMVDQVPVGVQRAEHGLQVDVLEVAQQIKEVDQRDDERRTPRRCPTRVS